MPFFVLLLHLPQDVNDVFQKEYMFKNAQSLSKAQDCNISHFIRYCNNLREVRFFKVKMYPVLHINTKSRKNSFKGSYLLRNFSYHILDASQETIVSRFSLVSYRIMSAE